MKAHTAKPPAEDADRATADKGTTAKGTDTPATKVGATNDSGGKAKGQKTTDDYFPKPDDPAATAAPPTKKPDTAARDPNRGTTTPPPPPPRRRRRVGPQWWLRNVRHSDIDASKRGYQVYVMKDAYGTVLYVGKSGGAGGVAPQSWEDRVRAHIDDPTKKEWIGEVDHISVTSDLSEMEAFALEQSLISQTKATNKNISPGEFTTRFPQGDLSANAQAASRCPTFGFDTDIVP